MSITETTIEAPAEALAVVIYRDHQTALDDLQQTQALAPYGVLAEVQAGALVRSGVSAAALVEAQSLVIVTTENYADALEIVRRGKLASKEADEERTSYTAVINPVVKWINDQYRAAINDGKSAAEIAWNKAGVYQREQQRIADEAAKKAREEQERAERKLREEAEAKRIAEEQARQREEDARRKAEEAAAAGDKAAQEAAEAEQIQARKEAERNALAAERREEKAEVVAAAPTYIPQSTAGALKGTGISKGRPLPQWAFESSDESACLLKIVKAAAEGSAAALMCLTINPAGAKAQATAKATVPGLRLWIGESAPGVRR
jgi:hypothetical protein